MITYTNSLSEIRRDDLKGFFVGWKNQPSEETFLKLLQQSYAIELAIDDETQTVVGFITAISDGVLSAYIPFLEVLPEHQKQGIGKELVSRMLKRLENLYMIDLTCDPELQEWYEKLNLKKSAGMSHRNYYKQAG